MARPDSATEALVAPATTVRGAPRLEWVDAARGFCVAAVVLYHVVLWQVAASPKESVDPPARSLWGFVDATLGSVRMPVLLAVSGLVLARQVRAGVHRSTTVFRSLNSYYLYVVWLAIYAVFYAVLRTDGLPHRVDGVAVLRQLAVPDTTLWYVYALAVYTIMLAALSRVPPAIVLPALTALTVVVHAAVDTNGQWVKVPELFVFFAIGVYGSEMIRRLAERASLVVLGVAAAAAVGVTACGRFVGDGYGAGLLFVLRGAAFMVVCVVAVVLVVRWRPAARLGVALGRRTLGVYVMHPLWIALLLTAAGAWASDAVANVLASRLALVYPVVVTIAIIAASIGVQSGLGRAGARWPFEMPARWRHALGRP
ncbi:acyltransferase [Cellulomonas sp. HZM]|uniref:acyltransferase family protein n=1 Tax=Cellulomonas sp. HZM TaxID=1454010 RepID=UPI0004932F18|nr:acyltransferase [Cellulomonas sp. HZM]